MLLAAGVLRRAFQDLVVVGKKSQEHRQDAYEFLTVRLWDDCLWHSILDSILFRHAVLEMVHERVKQLKDGRIVIV